MLKGINGMLADEPVNTGRQTDLDIAKAQMVLMLPFIHCIIECTSDEGLCSGIPYLFDTIIGGPFSGPMYLFAMGIGLVYSRKTTPGLQLKRGLILLGIFYLSNTCRFLIPYLKRTRMASLIFMEGTTQTVPRFMTSRIVASGRSVNLSSSFDVTNPRR
jgi:hypothetical protein